MLLRKILVAAFATLLATPAQAGPCSLTCQQKVNSLHLVCGKHSSPINAGTPIPVKGGNNWSLTGSGTMLTVSCAKSSPIAGPRECVKHNDNKAESFMGLFGYRFAETFLGREPYALLYGS
ncbi:hypothetical protein BKA56DRAFT_625856 [Ilyonectria sp. MPI-CAGE-AT-0026]|nr:hypothetical protein BKA56DRAFT_625856 [Ilyonectria sp. MPI-CAGE-AT-0026]